MENGFELLCMCAVGHLTYSLIVRLLIGTALGVGVGVDLGGRELVEVVT